MPEPYVPGQASRPPDRRFGVIGGAYPSGGAYAPGGRMDPARSRAFGLPNLRRNVCPTSS
jgi:hypothetical protein